MSPHEYANRASATVVSAVLNRGLVVYASRLAIRPFDSHGTGGERRSYGGDAMAEYESRCANNIERFVSGFHPTPNGVPGTLGRLRFRWQDTSSEVKLAPAAPGGAIAERGCLISIGSPAYNIVSSWIEMRFPELGSFVNSCTEMAISGSGQRRAASGLPTAEIRCARYCRAWALPRLRGSETARAVHGQRVT